MGIVVALFAFGGILLWLLILLGLFSLNGYFGAAFLVFSFLWLMAIGTGLYAELKSSAKKQSDERQAARPLIGTAEANKEHPLTSARME